MNENTIFRILEDLHPHPVAEIASHVNVSVEKVKLCLQFLAKYSFVTYDKQRETALIHADFLSLKEEKEKERKRLISYREEVSRPRAKFLIGQFNWQTCFFGVALTGPIASFDSFAGL